MTTLDTSETNVASLYERAAAGTRRYLSSVKTDQWGDPTPCDDWDVRTLVNHLVGGAGGVKTTFEGAAPQSSAGVDLLGDDPLRSFDDAVAGAVGALSAPRALSKTLQTRVGETPATNFAFARMQEMLIHGWDLAVALGQDATLDEELVEAAYVRALENRARYRAGTAFGPAEITPSDEATTQSKLLGILGHKG